MQNTLYFLLKGSVQVNSEEHPNTIFCAGQFILQPIGSKVEFKILETAECILYLFERPINICNERFNKGASIAETSRIEPIVMNMCPPLQYFVEGIRMFREAPADWLREVYVSETFLHKYGREALGRVSFEILTDAVFQKASDTQTPQGILCVLSMPRYELAAHLAIQCTDTAKAPLYMLLEDLHGPGKCRNDTACRRRGGR